MTGANSRRLPIGPVWHPVLLVIVLTGFAPSKAVADEWKVSPSVSLFQSFTSNAGLDPPGHEKADFFTTLAPAVEVHRDSPRLTFDLDYALEAIGYAREQELSEFRNNLQFASKATVVPELFFVDGRAAIEQQPIDTGDTGSGSSLAGTTNLATVYTYSLSPYINNHLGTFPDSEIRYTFNQVYGDHLSDTTANRVEGTLVSGRQFPRLLWTLSTNGQEIQSSRNISTRFAAAVS